MSWNGLTKKIPSKVQIDKDVSYEVLWSDEISSDDQLMGQTRFDDGHKQIIIRRGLSDKDTIVTYIHEVLHAISMEHGVKLTENQILALERSFYYMLKPNNVFKR